jgi:SAM-dependent methyltransferase
MLKLILLVDEADGTLLGRVKIAYDWIEEGDRLLDVGCSEGELLHWVSPKCRLAAGLDVDERTLRTAQARCPDAELHRGSADRLPFRDGCFTVVSMLDVLEHLTAPMEALEEVDRVLAPGGRFILSVPHKGTFGFIDAQKSQLFAAGRRLLLGKDDPVVDHRHFGLNEITGLLPGYEVGRMHSGGLLIYPLCGYALMVSDNIGAGRVSRAIRRLEEMDFTQDYGPRSWHIMLELRKEGER